jgi:hypothetical protein
MGLFASDKTIRLYFNDKGEITDKETEHWVDVLAEISTASARKLQNALGKPKVEYKDGEQVITFENMDSLPVEFLADVIVKWSEKEPINVNTIKKMRFDVAQNLYNKLNEIYKLR